VRLTLHSRFEDDDLVTIALEGTERRFKVQTALLFSTSDYFVKASSSSFIEANQRILTLPGCDVGTFELLLYWMGLRTLPDITGTISQLNRGSPERYKLATEQQLRLVRLWILADTIFIPRLQNAAMHSLRSLAAYARPESVEIIFSNTTENSPLRRWAIDHILCEWKRAGDYGQLKYGPQEFEIIGKVPGLMLHCLTVIADSGCGRLACHCNPPYYSCEPIEKYFVPEH